MHGIYAYIPETNHVPREHRVAAILVLLYMVLISLVLVLNTLYFIIIIIIISSQVFGAASHFCFA
jgi:hypothetical protein